MNTNKENRLSNKICPDGMSVEEWQIALRRENAIDAGFEVEHLDDNRIWGDYMVISNNGRYRVAFRGVLSDRNFCSCLDFRTNGLGTCKHLEAVTLHLQQHVDGYPWAGMEYNPPYSSIYVSYKGGRSVKIRVGEMQHMEYLRLAEQYFDADLTLPEDKYEQLPEIVNRAQKISNTFRCYDDVYELTESYSIRRTWQEQIRTKYPNGRIPMLRTTMDFYKDNEARAGIEQQLYEMTETGFGLMVSSAQEYFPMFVLRLAEVVLAHSKSNKVGVLIMQNKEDVEKWVRFKKYFTGIENQLEVLTVGDFTNKVSSGFTNAGFVYVDKANGLKEWRDITSMSIKRMIIDHLYMRIETMAYLTPVQLSSILQHISPFIIGPFYKFIHTYRPTFPLKDDGSNMPPETRHTIFPIKPSIIRDLQEIVISGSDYNPVEIHSVAEPLPEEKVLMLLKTITEVINDPEALRILNQKLKELQ